MCLRVNSRATNFPFIASPIKTSMKNPTVRSDPPSDIKKKYIYIYINIQGHPATLPRPFSRH